MHYWLHPIQRRTPFFCDKMSNIWIINSRQSKLTCGKWSHGYNVHSSIRLHSSRIHTARLLTVSPSMHCAGGLLRGGCLRSGGCLLLGGGGIPACTEAEHPPPVDRILDTLLKILPCPKLRLRAVITNGFLCITIIQGSTFWVLPVPPTRGKFWTFKNQSVPGLQWDILALVAEMVIAPDSIAFVIIVWRGPCISLW